MSIARKFAAVATPLIAAAVLFAGGLAANDDPARPATLASDECPADTHWNPELGICVDDTHW